MALVRERLGVEDDVDIVVVSDGDVVSRSGLVSLVKRRLV